MSIPTTHKPVLYQEIIHFLQPRNSGRYVDCTVGSAGHALGILSASAPDGKLLGIDLDPKALEIARERLAGFANRVILVRASFATLRDLLDAIGWDYVDGILFDLGMSSMQLADAERGFSFMMDAPLDMRFDPENPICAADLVNRLLEKELADLLYQFGEEQHARKIAQAILKARPLRTTGQLAQVVSQVVPRRGEIHPATRTFQAFRIAVNQELDALQKALPQAVASLSKGGRLAIISFHSLEDRIVKDFIRRESRDCICPPKQPVCTCGHRAMLKEVTRKPLRPKKEEVLANPRARSARLRIAEKIA